jgi:hypothetical protein
MATGRTAGKWFKFQVDDSGGTVRDIPVTTINDVGLTYDEVDVTALQDALKTALPGMPDVTITITGPFSNTAAAAASGTGAAPALSGSHTVLSAINGVNTPLTLGVYLGIRGYWATGDPCFGLTSSASVGFVCTNYTVNPGDMTYTAQFKVFAGSSAPAWGTAAFT